MRCAFRWDGIHSLPILTGFLKYAQKSPDGKKRKKKPMPKITFLRKDGSKKEIDAPENWSIMEVAVGNGITEIEGACGGSMACATCHCYVHPDWVAKVEAQDNEKSPEEEDTLDTAFDIRPTSRLGCQIKLTQALDGLIVALPGTHTGW